MASTLDVDAREIDGHVAAAIWLHVCVTDSTIYSIMCMHSSVLWWHAFLLVYWIECGGCILQIAHGEYVLLNLLLELIP